MSDKKVDIKMKKQQKTKTLGNCNAEMYMALAQSRMLAVLTKDYAKELEMYCEKDKEKLNRLIRFSSSMTQIEETLKIVTKNASGIYIVTQLMSNWKSKINRDVKVDSIINSSRSRCKMGAAEKKLEQWLKMLQGIDHEKFVNVLSTQNTTTYKKTGEKKRLNDSLTIVTPTRSSKRIKIEEDSIQIPHPSNNTILSKKNGGVLLKQKET